MRKLIAMLSTLTITSAITPLTIVCNENKINEGETKIDDSTNSKEILEDYGYAVLKAWVNGLLSDDCYENFSNHYLLNAREYQDFKWKDIIEEFERFLHKKYEIEFKIEMKNEEKDKILNDGLSKLKIDVSLFKIKEKWKILTSDLGLKIWQNDDSERLITLKKV